MLIPFTIDPDIFLDANTNLDCLKRHDDLVKLWGLIGQLVIPGEKMTTSKLFVAYQQAPQKVKLKWRDAFKHYRHKTGSLQFAEALQSDVALTDRVVCSGTKLASLDRDRAVLWGLEEEQYSKLIAQVLEICRFGHEDTTVVVKEILDLSTRPIKPEERPDEVWRERFHDLAVASRDIIVVDRYAIKDYLRPPQYELSGLERLMRKVAALETPGKKIIHLYSAYSLDWKAHGSNELTFKAACQYIVSKIRDLCRLLKGRALLEVHLHIASDHKFGHIVHYRYLSFDEKNIVELDTGLEPLSGSHVRRTCKVALVNWFAEGSQIHRTDFKKLKNELEISEVIDCRA